LRIIKHPGASQGRVFNVGGGPDNVISLREALDLVREIIGKRVRLGKSPWRVGDQKAYVTDSRTVRRATGWRPRVRPDEGIRMLAEWVVQNRDVIGKVVGKKR
jgi:CDP-paratose 2-epimerase